MTNPTTELAAPSFGARAEAILDNPLAGMSPWIVLSLLAGPGRLEVSALAALALSLGLVAVSLLRGQTLKLLEGANVVFFVALAIVGLAGSASVTSWMEGWIGEVSNLALLAIVVGSIAVGRPFTLQYAKESTPEEQWDTPLFMRINTTISWAWAGAFIVAAVAGAIGNLVLDNPSNLWTSWIVQIAAIIAAIQFTDWYPDNASARYLQQEGQPTDPPPPVTDLLVTLVGGLVTIGIVALVFSAGPWWVGVGFIVAGSSLGTQMRKLSPSDPEAIPSSRGGRRCGRPDG